MATLYDNNMALVFDEMYQVFINYDEEFDFYKRFLVEYNCSNILEIGCGTGNLAKRFIENNYNYLGLDFSQSMIEIAKKRNKKGNFTQADMRNFSSKKQDSILITGRTTSYIISNKDLDDTFNSVYKNLNKNGIFIFDFIDANRYIPFIITNKDIEHAAFINKKQYVRIGNWIQTPNAENFMLDWNAQYYEIIENEKKLISKDFSTVRVFTLNEIEIFLYKNGFQILETIDRKTYAYDTYVIVAKKS